MKKLHTAICILLMSSGLGYAQLFNFSGASGSASDNPGENAAVSGTADVNVGAGTVKFTINNDGDGTITGFAFLNSPSMSDRPNTDELSWLPVVYSLGTRAWSNVSVDNYWQNDKPYYGASADSPSPTNGIQFGESGAEFTFIAIGGNLQDLVDKWAMPNSDPIWSSSNPTSDLLFRVQETSGNAGSDKIAVNFSSTPVPEPSTYGIIGAFSLGIMILLRKIRKK